MGSSCSGRGSASQKPNKKLRKALERAVTRYSESLSTANSYLRGRGIEEEAAEAARLGVVTSPEVSHEQYVGRLCIPYLDKLGVYAVKFRCMIEHSCKESSCSKYLSPLGQESSLYGVLDADAIATTIHIAEGELDRLILKQVFPGDSAISVPGAQSWKPHYKFHFGGFDRVVIWPDGDKAGEDLANRIQKDVRSAEVAPVPKGLDVTDLYVTSGADTLRQMIGEDDEDADS